MKRFLTLALVGAVTLGAGSIAYANVCAFDPVPAATLLFPYVTYNYAQGAAGYNTLFAITNVSNEAAIAHVTLWTDYSRAILDFNVLLTGYDVQTISIRDILAQGLLPVTTWGPHSGNEGAYEDGPVSGANDIAAFDPPNLPDPQPTNALGTRCNTGDPNYPGRYVTPISGNILGLFEGWLKTSQTVPRYFENCDGNPYVPPVSPWWLSRGTDGDTFMYITVDVVETCNTLFPDQDAFYDGEIRFENVLMGDVIFVNEEANFSEAFNAVHLEASASLPFIATTVPTAVSGQPASFYHRYNYPDFAPFSGDFREPLPTAWAFRYIRNDTTGVTTNVRAWKGGILTNVVPDLTDDDLATPGLSPAGLVSRNCIPYTYYVWDEEENVTTSTTDPFSYPSAPGVVLNLLPLETQEVNVDQFNTLGGSGWMLFVWPNSNFAGPPDTSYDWYQTWMGVQYVKAGEYSAAREAVVMANYNCFSDQVLPQLGILYNPPVSE